MRLQDDVIEIYNALTDFSNTTLVGRVPISVHFDSGINSLCFSQRGKTVSINVLNYYCEDLKKIKNAFLLPEDYDKLMSTMSILINSGNMLQDRVCVSPEDYGFTVYGTKPSEAKNGPKLLAKMVFVSGNSWVYNRYIKYKYKDII